MEIKPSVVFSGGYQKAIVCSPVANLKLHQIAVESTMRVRQGIWCTLDTSHAKTRSVSKERNSAGNQGCETTWPEEAVKLLWPERC